MTPASDVVELNSNDELGQIEAAEIPTGEVDEADVYVEDLFYDESLAALDPDEQGVDLPTSEEEWDQ